MKNSSLFSMSIHDLVKGFIVALLTAFLSGLTITIEDGSLPTLIELKQLALVGLAAGVGYLAKNFLTNSKDQFVKPEPKENIKL